MDKKKFNIYYNVYVKQISYLLKLLGININTVPVLDIAREKTSKVIGDRSFSKNKKIVNIFGNFTIDQFHKNNIATVIKHIPGHGLGKVDSHYKLPIINNSNQYLLKNDFLTFKNKNSLFAMTGHLLFKKIDSLNSVTHSKKIIKLIIKSAEKFLHSLPEDYFSEPSCKPKLESYMSWHIITCY